MATKSSIAARQETAFIDCLRLMESLASRTEVEPPDEVPGNVREPALRTAVRLECMAEFLSRHDKTVAAMIEAASSARRLPRKPNEQSKRMDSPAPAA